MSDERIRRVSIDKFYEIVTGNSDAFMLLCEQLPLTIDYILKNKKKVNSENDTVIDELSLIDKDILRALYLLAFKTYNGFDRFYAISEFIKD